MGIYALRVGSLVVLQCIWEGLVVAAGSAGEGAKTEGNAPTKTEAAQSVGPVGSFKDEPVAIPSTEPKDGWLGARFASKDVTMDGLRAVLSQVLETKSEGAMKRVVNKLPIRLVVPLVYHPPMQMTCEPGSIAFEESAAASLMDALHTVTVLRGLPGGSLSAAYANLVSAAHRAQQFCEGDMAQQHPGKVEAVRRAVLLRLVNMASLGFRLSPTTGPLKLFVIPLPAKSDNRPLHLVGPRGASQAILWQPGDQAAFGNSDPYYQLFAEESFLNAIRPDGPMSSPLDRLALEQVFAEITRGIVILTKDGNTFSLSPAHDVAQGSMLSSYVMMPQRRQLQTYLRARMPYGLVSDNLTRYAEGSDVIGLKTYVENKLRQHWAKLSAHAIRFDILHAVGEKVSSAVSFDADELKQPYLFLHLMGIQVPDISRIVHGWHQVRVTLAQPSHRGVLMKLIAKRGASQVLRMLPQQPSMFSATINLAGADISAPVTSEMIESLVESLRGRFKTLYNRLWAQPHNKLLTKFLPRLEAAEKHGISDIDLGKVTEETGTAGGGFGRSLVPLETDTLDPNIA